MPALRDEKVMASLDCEPCALRDDNQYTAPSFTAHNTIHSTALSHFRRHCSRLCVLLLST
jgi:hypothetical protein